MASRVVFGRLARALVIAALMTGAAIAGESPAPVDSGDAISLLQATLSKLADAERVDALLQLGTALRRAGRVSEAIPALTQARALATALEDPASAARALAGRSDAALLLRKLQAAHADADMAVELAGQADADGALAEAYSAQGNALFALERHGAALDAYASALGHARAAATDSSLARSVLINSIHAHLASNSPALALDALREAHRHKTDAIEQDRHAQLYDLLAIGHLAVRLHPLLPAARNELERLGHGTLNEASALAEQANDPRGRSLAAGQLGELYVAAGRRADAGALFARALFHAEAALAPELSARWHWRTGRELQALGRRGEAIDTYLLAIDALREVLPSLLFGRRGQPRSFRDTTGTLYLELAGLMLDEATEQPATSQQSLKRMRGVMEAFKAVELKNYFLDDCVADRQAENQALQLDTLLTEGTASLYPVVLPNRLVLLLALAGGELSAFSVDVSAEQVTTTAREFRELMNPAGNRRRLLARAQALYDWLVAPIRETLDAAGVRTLVVVPDGALRTIPFAALHDGKDFIARRYALAVSPGLALFDTRPVSAARDDLRVLLGGISDSVQGFEALPHVDAELDAVAQAIGGTQLRDSGFRKPALFDALERTPFNIVSLASHGVIASDPAQSFVLTYDDRFNLDELERFVRLGELREQPVELLVLSACDTAVGDERAALGLAGLALRAGARSVMASLWAVNDASTATLVPAFFKQLGEQGVNKAQALQRAQLQLLDAPETAHPFYWAAFVLAGNWR